MAPLPPGKPRPWDRLSQLGWLYALIGLVAAGGGVYLAGLVVVERDGWSRLLVALFFFGLAGWWGIQAVNVTREEAAAAEEHVRLSSVAAEPPSTATSPEPASLPGLVSPGSGDEGRDSAVVRWVGIGYVVLMAVTVWASVDFAWSLATVERTPDGALSSDRPMWLGFLALPGLALASAWTWRLGRWLLGRSRPAAPVRVEVLVAHLRWRPAGRLADPIGPGQGFPVAFWLRLSQPDGTIGFQRAMFSRTLAEFAFTAAAAGRPVIAHARRCPGPGQMYLLTVPEVGRVWPASTVHPREPGSYYLLPYERALAGRKHPDGWLLGGGRSPVVVVVAFTAATVLAWFLAGLVACVYIPVLVGSLHLWQGGSPLRGVYQARLSI